MLVSVQGTCLVVFLRWFGVLALEQKVPDRSELLEPTELQQAAGHRPVRTGTLPPVSLFAKSAAT